MRGGFSPLCKLGEAFRIKWKRPRIMEAGMLSLDVQSADASGLRSALYFLRVASPPRRCRS